MKEKVYVLVDNKKVKTPRVENKARTMDLWFPVFSPDLLHTIEDNLMTPVYLEIDLGIKTYYNPNLPEILMLPRSSASLMQWHVKDEGYSDYINVYHGASFLTLANTVGVIDSTYRGEWKARCLIHGDTSEFADYINKKPWLQAVPLFDAEWILVDDVSQIPEELINTERGEGRFGSTDKGEI